MKQALWTGTLVAMAMLWASTSFAAWRGADEGKECGGVRMVAVVCKTGLFCDLGPTCNQRGKCKKKPTVCPQSDLATHACGCDGFGYPTKCAAEMAGMTVKSAGPCAAAEKVVVDPASDTTVNVRERTDFTLKLTSNASTGYKWKVVSTDRTFGYPYKSRYESTSPPGAVGGGGYEFLTWKTKTALSMIGTHTVKLNYARGTETPAKTLTIKVRIKR